MQTSKMKPGSLLASQPYWGMPELAIASGPIWVRRIEGDEGYGSRAVSDGRTADGVLVLVPDSDEDVRAWALKEDVTSDAPIGLMVLQHVRNVYRALVAGEHVFVFNPGFAPEGWRWLVMKPAKLLGDYRTYAVAAERRRIAARADIDVKRANVNANKKRLNTVNEALTELRQPLARMREEGYDTADPTVTVPLATLVALLDRVRYE